MVSQPPSKVFYLNCLEEIASTFSSPLTLIHQDKLKQLLDLQQNHISPVQWEEFRLSSPYSDNVFPQIAAAVQLLLWISEYVLLSVGNDLASRKLSFDISKFQECQQHYSDFPPFSNYQFGNIFCKGTLQSCLTYFGAESFKALQLEAICSTMEGNDSLCLFPTGYGKSLIYQLPASVEYGVSLLFSPLCSLLSDQVNTLNSLGIKSVWIHSGLSELELNGILNSLNSFVVPWRIVLLTPEKYSYSWRIQNVIGEFYSVA